MLAAQENLVRRKTIDVSTLIFFILPKGLTICECMEFGVNYLTRDLKVHVYIVNMNRHSFKSSRLFSVGLVFISQRINIPNYFWCGWWVPAQRAGKERKSLIFLFFLTDQGYVWSTTMYFVYRESESAFGV